MRRGKKVLITKISYRETTLIELTANAPCEIEGDGEILGKLPAKIELLARTINFLM